MNLDSKLEEIKERWTEPRKYSEGAVLCRGSFVFGNNCRKCERCLSVIEEGVQARSDIFMLLEVVDKLMLAVHMRCAEEDVMPELKKIAEKYQSN